MNSHLKQVRQFNEFFGLPIALKPALPKEEIIRLRVARLKEEVAEIEEAIGKCDLEGVLDGLVDLEYILHGTTLAFGLDDVYEIAFYRVHKANMQKTRAVRADDSKHGTTYDILKPEGWQAPRFNDLLKEACK